MSAPRELIIIGASASVADILWMVDALNAAGHARWRVRGVLDDAPTRAATNAGALPVLGPIADARAYADARFIIAVAHYRRPLARNRLAERLGLDPERYATLVHPSAFVAPDARIGAGVLAFQSVLIGSRARIGDHAMLSPFCLVSHDASVEAGATMAPAASLCGGATLKAGAYAGARSIVKDGVTVGAGAVVGIGSVVIRDVPESRTVFGNPARPGLGHRIGP
jgi:sugar O-acyltransferase (sialic acid O-acetyltransferase NeuD family)